MQARWNFQQGPASAWVSYRKRWTLGLMCLMQGIVKLWIFSSRRMEEQSQLSHAHPGQRELEIIETEETSKQLRNHREQANEESAAHFCSNLGYLLSIV